MYICIYDNILGGPAIFVEFNFGDYIFLNIHARSERIEQSASPLTKFLFQNLTS